MKKKVFTLILMASAGQFFAQSIDPLVIGGVQKGDANATVEILSQNGTKGFMPPRFTTAQITALQSKLTTDSKGLIVYCTDDNCLKTWLGTSWSSCSGSTATQTALETTSTAIPAVVNSTVAVPSTNVQGAIGDLAKELSQKWDTKGNKGTVAGTNFIGTTDNQDIVFKRQGFEIGRLGSYSVSFGEYAASGNTGKSVIAIGNDALINNKADYNIGIGRESLKTSILSGGSNVAIGYRSMFANVSGGSNVAVGDMALLSNTSGGFNVALGKQALYNNIAGDSNVGVGISALSSNLSGNDNVGIGNATLSRSKLSSFNVGIGSACLISLISGGGNVAIGYNSGIAYGNIGATQTLNNMENSVLIGSSTRPLNDSGYNEVVIGYQAIGRGSNTVQIGNSSMTSIGGSVEWSIGSDLRLKKDIVTSSYGLNFINKLRPVTYKMKTGPTDLQSGFIAQEVEVAANSIGYEFNGIVKPQNDQDFYSLRYAGFVVPLVKAVQEQQTQIDEQQAQIEQQQKDIQELKQLVQKLLNK
ncbi:tail fiber domain-containing protein [Flavobacterium sp. KJJ]|uniref:tail fiber domain-containing protein n=1 Tax=Flavobacterium sp. KJJ TaxID=1270193 RepID=UPI000492FE23|nr:tail fiber domain-containing protein [Flavobacterium sp. KJJ]